uniref:Uncharacterized protein n=1 Tax=Mycena chlorophos TaxID=658473 RepID=A0ABQ0LBC2_MYCCL|nr:predicted protein [Mycena chlorophos]
MDIDDDMSGRTLRQRHAPSQNAAPNPSKRVAVAGVDRQQLDEAREDKAYHRDVAKDARNDRRMLTEKNALLQKALDEAKRIHAEKDAQIRGMDAQIHDMQLHIAQTTEQVESMEQQGSAMHAHLLENQKKMEEMYQQLQQQHALMQQQHAQMQQQHEHMNNIATNTAELQRAALNRENEVLQLRSEAQLARKKLQSVGAAIPKRRGRVTRALPKNTSNNLIELPLDPAPSSAVPSDSAPNHVLEHVAQANDVDVDVLTSMMSQLVTLIGGNNGRVIIPSQPKARPKVVAKKELAPATKDLKDHAHLMLRTAINKLFDTTNFYDFALRKSATEKEVNEYALAQDGVLNDETPSELPKVPAEFDFNDGYLGSMWNFAYMEHIVNSAVEEDAKGMNYVGKGEIRRAFLEMVLSEQLERIRGIWFKFQPKHLVKEGRMETKAEAMARGQFILDQQREESKKINGQHATFRRRSNTTSAVLYFKEQDGARDLPTWQRMAELLSVLGPAGMSEEEASSELLGGSKVNVFNVKICVWREPKIAEYMRMIDGQTARMEETHNGRSSTTRKRVNVNGTRNAPKELPHNLYNPKWLAAQSLAYKKSLNVSKEGFALFVAATERMGE